MSALIAVIAAIIVWWISTGTVIALARQGASRLGAVMALMTAVAIGGLYGLYVSLSMPNTTGTYLGFGSALALWAWHETTFLLGLITGPRRIELSEAPKPKNRFRGAFLTVRDHEIALALTAVMLIWFMHDGVNLTGLFTFLLLWIMRISTKVNIFLGAEHAVSEMLPERLSYLKTYFRTDRTSHWFWVSMAATTLLFALLVTAAMRTDIEHAQVMWSLLAAFCALALIEHLFLVLPIRDSALWSWAIRMCPAKNDDAILSISKKKTGEVPHPEG